MGGQHSQVAFAFPNRNLSLMASYLGSIYSNITHVNTSIKSAKARPLQSLSPDVSPDVGRLAVKYPYFTTTFIFISRNLPDVGRLKYCKYKYIYIFVLKVYNISKLNLKFSHYEKRKKSSSDS